MKAALHFLVRILLAACIPLAAQAQLPPGTGGAQEVRRLMALDVDFYQHLYADVRNLTTADANKHWLRQGLREGRQSSPSFAIRDYLHRYPDLLQRFGPTGYERALDHFIREGRSQGRDARPQAVVLAEQQAKQLAQQKLQAQQAQQKGGGTAAPDDDDDDDDPVITFQYCPVRGAGAATDKHGYKDVKGTCREIGIYCAGSTAQVLKMNLNGLCHDIVHLPRPGARCGASQSAAWTKPRWAKAGNDLACRPGKPKRKGARCSPVTAAVKMVADGKGNCVKS